MKDFVKNITACSVYAIILCLIGIPNIPNALAIGLSGPAGSEVFFTPGMEITLSYEVLMRDASDADFSVGMLPNSKVDLTKYVTWEPKTVTNQKDQAIPLKVHFKFPESIEVPGKHTFLITVTEGGTKGKGSILVRTSAEAQFSIIVLHNGIYPTVGVWAKDIGTGDASTVTVEVGNLGTENISSASVKIEVFSYEGKLMDTYNLEPQPVRSQGSASFAKTISSQEYPAGDYTVRAIVIADGKEISADTKFKVGSMTINIISYPESIIAGKINQFDIQVESKWNQEIPNVFAEINVFNKKARSVPANVPAFGRATLTSYIDLSDVNEIDERSGEGTITVIYSGLSTSKDISLTIQPEVKLSPQPAGIQEKLTAGFKPNSTTVLIIAITVLIALNVFWMFRKRPEVPVENKTREKR